MGQFQKRYRPISVVGFASCLTILLFISVQFNSLNPTAHKLKSVRIGTVEQTDRHSRSIAVQSQNSQSRKPLNEESLAVSAPITVVIESEAQAYLNQPIRATAAVTLSNVVSGHVIYPARYEWEWDQHLGFLRFSSNGLTSTATVTWTTAGIKELAVVADTPAGPITNSIEIPVVVLSPLLSAMQTTTFSYRESGGISATFLIPAQNLPEMIQLVYLPLSKVSLPVGPNSLDQGLKLMALQDGVARESYQFEEAVRLSLIYDASMVNPADETVLTLLRWDGEKWVHASEGCDKSVPTVTDPAKNQISSAVCRLGQFSLFTLPIQLYTPLVY